MAFIQSNRIPFGIPIKKFEMNMRNYLLGLGEIKMRNGSFIKKGFRYCTRCENTHKIEDCFVDFRGTLRCPIYTVMVRNKPR